VQESNIIGETMESDCQEGTSIAIEEMEQLETELVPEIQNNSGEEGICFIDGLKSMPEPQVGLAVEQELVLETQNNSAEEGICSINRCEEGICSIDALTSAQFGVTVDMHEQPYGRYDFFY
jgi:hypothetical protein